LSPNRDAQHIYAKGRSLGAQHTPHTRTCDDGNLADGVDRAHEDLEATINCVCSDDAASGMKVCAVVVAPRSAYLRPPPPPTGSQWPTGRPHSDTATEGTYWSRPTPTSTTSAHEQSKKKDARCRPSQKVLPSRRQDTHAPPSARCYRGRSHPRRLSKKWAHSV